MNVVVGRYLVLRFGKLRRRKNAMYMDETVTLACACAYECRAFGA